MQPLANSSHGHRLPIRSIGKSKHVSPTVADLSSLPPAKFRLPANSLPVTISPHDPTSPNCLIENSKTRRLTDAERFTRYNALTATQQFPMEAEKPYQIDHISPEIGLDSEVFLPAMPAPTASLLSRINSTPAGW
ncbi:hypothetical protein R1flu_000022 [Riccia fluitans]|uniref:Uncharacterized protein n=1 Tax=Riccia fluitans TaxID=41844 RepID=A0ABD1Y2E0_9MARC